MFSLRMWGGVDLTGYYSQTTPVAEASPSKGGKVVFQIGHPETRLRYAHARRIGTPGGWVVKVTLMITINTGSKLRSLDASN